MLERLTHDRETGGVDCLASCRCQMLQDRCQGRNLESFFKSLCSLLVLVQVECPAPTPTFSVPNVMDPCWGKEWGSLVCARVLPSYMQHWGWAKMWPTVRYSYSRRPMAALFCPGCEDRSRPFGIGCVGPARDFNPNCGAAQFPLPPSFKPQADAAAPICVMTIEAVQLGCYYRPHLRGSCAQLGLLSSLHRRARKLRGEGSSDANCPGQSVSAHELAGPSITLPGLLEGGTDWRPRAFEAAFAVTRVQKGKVGQGPMGERAAPHGQRGSAPEASLGPVSSGVAFAAFAAFALSAAAAAAAGAAAAAAGTRSRWSAYIIVQQKYMARDGLRAVLHGTVSVRLQYSALIEYY